MTRDKKPGDGWDPLSLNRYTYTHDNPISFIDPDGEALVLILGATAILVGGLMLLSASAPDFSEDMTYELDRGINQATLAMRENLSGIARRYLFAKRTDKEKSSGRPANPNKSRKKKHIDPQVKPGRGHPQPRRSGRIPR